jgi:hypothetical protein
MDAENLEVLLAEAVKQYTTASPADRAAIAEAAAGALDALLSGLDGQASHEGVRQLAALLIVERAKAEGRSAANLQTKRRSRGARTPTGAVADQPVPTRRSNDGQAAE